MAIFLIYFLRVSQGLFGSDSHVVVYTVKLIGWGLCCTVNRKRWWCAISFLHS